MRHNGAPHCTGKCTHVVNTAFDGATATGSAGVITHDTTPTSEGSKHLSSRTLPTVRTTGEKREVFITMPVSFKAGSITTTTSANVFTHPNRIADCEGEAEADEEGDKDGLGDCDALAVLVTDFVKETVGESEAEKDTVGDTEAVRDLVGVRVGVNDLDCVRVELRVLLSDACTEPDSDSDAV